MMQEKLLSQKEAADFLDIDEDELEELVGHDIITAYKIGGRFVRFKKEELTRIKSRIKGTKSDEARVFTQDYQSPGVQERFEEFIYSNGIYMLVVILGLGAVLFLLFK